jgi:hypothetical protein
MKAVLIGGLAALRIRYSDESRGVLTVSCTPVGTPARGVRGSYED